METITAKNDLNSIVAFHNKNVTDKFMTLEVLKNLVSANDSYIYEDKTGSKSLYVGIEVEDLNENKTRYELFYFNNCSRQLNLDIDENTQVNLVVRNKYNDDLVEDKISVYKINPRFDSKAYSYQLCNKYEDYKLTNLSESSFEKMSFLKYYNGYADGRHICSFALWKNSFYNIVERKRRECYTVVEYNDLEQKDFGVIVNAALKLDASNKYILVLDSHNLLTRSQYEYQMSIYRNADSDLLFTF